MLLLLADVVFELFVLLVPVVVLELLALLVPVDVILELLVLLVPVVVLELLALLVPVVVFELFVLLVVVLELLVAELLITSDKLPLPDEFTVPLTDVVVLLPDKALACSSISTINSSTSSSSCHPQDKQYNRNTPILLPEQLEAL